MINEALKKVWLGLFVLRIVSNDEFPGFGIIRSHFPSANHIPLRRNCSNHEPFSFPVSLFCKLAMVPVALVNPTLCKGITCPCSVFGDALGIEPPNGFCNGKTI